MVLAHNLNAVERTQDIHITLDVTFGSMLLKKKTLSGLEASGFYKPSPIQLHGIPLGKCGFDLFLEAKSGTGKTAVFTVIALEKLDLHKDLQSIMLAPTREIASQISDVIKQIGSQYKGLNVEVVMGGLPIEEDIAKLKKKVHILVGSPGRMRHLIQDKLINVSAVRLLVLDEADKLMEKSFQSEINYIFSVLPKEKQVVMSSATYPESLKLVMENYVKKVQHICPDSTAVLLGINQLVTTVDSHSNIVRQTQIKFKELLKILTQREFKQCLIFCNYQIRVVELCKMLLGAKWPAEQLHAQLEQCDRLDALKILQEYRCRILVSTDLAARGIDASNVDLVINFEPPYDWQIYLHRMGRAGRFGAYGTVITILSVGKEMSKFKEMIRSYNSSLNLINMWDNNKFELDDDQCTSLESITDSEEGICSTPKLPEIEQQMEDTCAVTLKAKKCIKNKSNVESFTMLLNSSVKTQECKIESFNDLMTSLKIHEENKPEENNNETINVTKNSDLILNLKAKPKISLTDQSSSDDSDLEKCPIKNIKSKTHSSKEFTMPLSKSCFNTHVKENSSIDEKHINGIHNAKSKKLTNISDSHKALLDAGLPTAFGSTISKLKQHRPQNERITTNIQNSMNNNENNTLKEPSTKVSRRKHSESNMLHINNACYNTKSTTFSKPAKHDRHRKSVTYNEHSEMRNGTRNIISEPYDMYSAWYNQVKLHVKQVEMSLYINELSNM